VYDPVTTERKSADRVEPGRAAAAAVRAGHRVDGRGPLQVGAEIITLVLKAALKPSGTICGLQGCFEHERRDQGADAAAGRFAREYNM
jgi:hypothetical protein